MNGLPSGRATSQILNHGLSVFPKLNNELEGNMMASWLSHYHQPVAEYFWIRLCK